MKNKIYFYFKLKSGEWAITYSQTFSRFPDFWWKSYKKKEM
jgi:ABC-type transport system substrate-binding protein